MEYSELENLDVENITFRRPRKSSSMCDMSNLSNNINMSTSIISLPNRSFEESYSLQSEQIKKLTIELESANQEIENLNSENKDLRTQLEKIKRIVNMYKKMGLTGFIMEQPKEQRSIKKTKKGKPKFNSSPLNVDLSMDKKVNVSNKVEEYYCDHDEVLEYGKFEDNITYTKQSNELSINKKKVLILADQQGKHVCKYLQQLLGSNYFVSSFCKPDANMASILSSEKEYISTFNDDDIVIVLGGTNDRNPFEFQSSLSNWLQVTRNINILFSEVPYNRVLNESKLNYVLNFVCSKFENTTYVDMDYSRTVPSPKNFSVNLCRTLLKEVLHIDYKTKLMQFNKKKQSVSNITDIKVKEISTQTYISLLDKIVFKSKNDVTPNKDDSDNFGSNSTKMLLNEKHTDSEKIRNAIEQDKLNNINNNINEIEKETNDTNEPYNSNNFFRV